MFYWFLHILHLKFHPINNLYGKKFKSQWPDNITIVDRIENNKLSDTYDFVLFNDNSYGIEAFFYGIESFEIDFFMDNLVNS